MILRFWQDPAIIPCLYWTVVVKIRWATNSGCLLTGRSTSTPQPEVINLNWKKEFTSTSIWDELRPQGGGITLVIDWGAQPSRRDSKLSHCSSILMGVRWLEHLMRMPVGRLPLEVSEAIPAWRRSHGRSRTGWKDYMSGSDSGSTEELEGTATTTQMQKVEKKMNVGILYVFYQE